jgi:dihydropteroate synthase
MIYECDTKLRESETLLIAAVKKPQIKTHRGGVNPEREIILERRNGIAFGIAHNAYILRRSDESMLRHMPFLQW